MNCPYCNNEMVKGVIEGDGRASLRWIKDGKRGLLDRMADALDEKDVIAKAHPLGKTTVESYKCNTCNKIIIDLK